MYSAAKAAIERETQVQPTQVAAVLKTEDLTEKTRIIIDMLKPLETVAEARLKANRDMDAARKALINVSDALTQINTTISNLTAKLDEIEQLKNSNSELERSVLERINTELSST